MPLIQPIHTHKHTHTHTYTNPHTGTGNRLPYKVLEHQEVEFSVLLNETDIWTGGAGDLATNPVNGGQPALPAEP